MRTAALLFAIATTPSKFWRPTAYHYEQAQKEYVRLSGCYGYRNVIGGGVLHLRADGTFEFTYPSCTDHFHRTTGNWYPLKEQIEFEPEFYTYWDRDFRSLAPPVKIDSEPIKKGDWSHLPWKSPRMQIVSKGSTVGLYPLDPSHSFKIIKIISHGPLVKYSGTKW